MLAAPRKFSWENAFIDLSMADHNMVAAAAEEAKEAAEAAAAAESVSGISHSILCVTLVLLKRYNTITINGNICTTLIKQQQCVHAYLAVMWPVTNADQVTCDVSAVVEHAFRVLSVKASRFVFTQASQVSSRCFPQNPSLWKTFQECPQPLGRG